MAEKEERIRIRAYEIWEREGRLDGRHEHNREEARREIEAEDDAGGSPELVSNAAVAGRPDGAVVLKKPTGTRTQRNGIASSSVIKRQPRPGLAETKS